MHAADAQGERRPISAPAILTNTVAPAEPAELVDYYCGQRANPRSPKPAGAVFTMDQEPMNYVETAKALLQHKRERQVADPCVEAVLSAAEEKREAERSYSNRDVTAPSSSATTLSKHVDIPAALPIAAIASKKAASLDSLANAIRKGKHKGKNERPAAILLQRQFRRHRVAAQGQRLIAVLHLLRTEITAPRMPTMVTKGFCSPSTYLAECVLEYEYQLEVENLSRCLVESSRASTGASRYLGPTQAVRKCVLSPEEVSSLHDAVQEHINDGELLSSPSLAFPEGVLSPWAIRALDFTLRRLTADEVKLQLHTSFVSFLLDSRKENVGLATPSSSSSASSAAVPWKPANGDVPSSKEKLNIVLDVLQQGTAAVTSDVSSVTRLAAGVPKEWFVGLTDAPVAQDVQLGEVPYVATASTVAMQALSADEAQPIWSRGNDPELEHDRRIESRRARRRVMGAEYSSGSDSEEDVLRRIGESLAITGDDDLVGTAEYFRKRHEHETALKRRMEEASSPLQNPRPQPTSVFDPHLWGLVGTSPEATRQAAAIVMGKDIENGEVRRMVLQPRRSRESADGARQGNDGGGSPAVPSICVICELDSIGVRRCVCGNWIHPECAIDDSSMSLMCSRYCS